MGREENSVNINKVLESFFQFLISTYMRSKYTYVSIHKYKYCDGTSHHICIRYIITIKYK